MTETCGIIAPRLSQLLRDIEGSSSGECILPLDDHNHDVFHVFETTDGRYFKWQGDFECGCCEPEESDRCYDVDEIGKEEVQRLLEGRG